MSADETLLNDGYCTYKMLAKVAKDCGFKFYFSYGDACIVCPLGGYDEDVLNVDCFQFGKMTVWVEEDDIDFLAEKIGATRQDFLDLFACATKVAYTPIVKRGDPNKYRICVLRGRPGLGIPKTKFLKVKWNGGKNIVEHTAEQVAIIQSTENTNGEFKDIEIADPNGDPAKCAEKTDVNGDPIAVVDSWEE